MSSSSVSDEELSMRGGSDCGGKMKAGRVGIETGCEGLTDRLTRWGKVGEIGDDCGVLRRRKEEIGILAMRSESAKVNFSGRLELVVVRPSAEDLCFTVRTGTEGHGEEDSALEGGCL